MASRQRRHSGGARFTELSLCKDQRGQDTTATIQGDHTGYVQAAGRITTSPSHPTTDTANSLHLIDHPPISPYANSKESQAHTSRITRINKFKRILQASTIPIDELRPLAWSGVPEEVRPMVWQVLLGYLPTNSERRVATLERKRKEYLAGVQQAFEKGTAASDASTGSGHGTRRRGLDEAVWHQISIDVPRTNPHLPLYAYEATQRSLERILYVWAIRHPASGYVQGINDLATPFWQVFLGMYITDGDIESGMDPGQLPKPVLDAVEADTFWCLTKLLDGIQDNYVHAQPGIVRQVAALRDLTKRIDANLVNHMEEESVEFMQFSFRWMNCLLMREISVKSTIRMWDTYLVCNAILVFVERIELTSRRPRSKGSRNSTSMCAQHFWSSGATSSCVYDSSSPSPPASTNVCLRWTFRKP